MANTEKRYWVTLDERKLSSKPDEKYKKTITQHLTSKRCLAIDEFARHVTQPYGLPGVGQYSIAPGQMLHGQASRYLPLILIRVQSHLTRLPTP